MAPKNILVVDDDPDQAELLALMLSGDGRRVSAYSDPFRALAALSGEGEGEAVDLLIADLSMPWMDGKAMVARAREHQPLLRIFLISGYSRGAEIAAQEGLRFFAKPLDFDLLRLAINDG